MTFENLPTRNLAQESPQTLIRIYTAYSFSFLLRVGRLGAIKSTICHQSLKQERYLLDLKVRLHRIHIQQTHKDCTLLCL